MLIDIIFWSITVILKILVFFTLGYLDSSLLKSINQMKSISIDLESQLEDQPQNCWWAKIKSIFTYKVGSVNVVLVSSLCLIALGIGYLVGGGFFPLPPAEPQNPIPDPPVVDLSIPGESSALPSAPSVDTAPSIGGPVQVSDVPGTSGTVSSTAIDPRTILPLPAATVALTPNFINPIQGYH